MAVQVWQLFTRFRQIPTGASARRALVPDRRAYVYGLGARGQAGVAAALDIIRKELDVTMALTGVGSLVQIDRGLAG
jgi:hypothetical protein